MSKTYLEDNVLQAAQQRLEFIFDEFDKIIVSYSGGKDSTVLLELARQEAEKRNRNIYAMFIDLEAQYKSTIEQVKNTIIDIKYIIPIWVCLPLNLRNAVSVFQTHWQCWDKSQQKYWVRDMPNYDCIINENSNLPFFRYGMEFEEFIVEFPKWFCNNNEKYASLVAIRADESLNRYKAVVKKETIKKSAYITESNQSIRWATVLDKKKFPNIVSLYPIYDFRTEDVWRYTFDNCAHYNRVYDAMHLAGIPLSQQRICQPYGDDQRRGLDLFAKIEPETWRKILDRVAGVNYGAKYARQKMMGYHRGLKLPNEHTWKSYTFFLLSTLPETIREKYLANFAIFLEWWMRNGCPNLNTMNDDETTALKSSNRNRLPSWRRLCLSILKNDFWGKSLSIGMIKYVYNDVYDRINNGDVIKVRKSVKPVYSYLRNQYQQFIDTGKVNLELPHYNQSLEIIKERYADL